MRLKIIAWLAVLGFGTAFGALAQEDAPQVLTSDLALRQQLESDRLTVDFVIVDEDNVVKVTIDGEEQQFEPGDTVLITKEFVFTPGRHIIKVVAEDEEGNVRERTYLVAYQVPLELTAEEKVEEEPPLRVNFVFDVRLEVDDNPTQDLSLPFSVSDIGEIEGVVDDSEQEDNRVVLKGIASFAWSDFSAFVGVVDTSYSDADNEPLESSVIFFGGKVNFGESDGGFALGASLTDVSLGGEDFSRSLTVTPAYESRSRDSDGTVKHVLALDVTAKSFEDPPAGTTSPPRDDGTEITARWNYDSRDAARQDSYKRIFAIGTRTEGTDESEFTFLRWDADWQNRWDSGFRWDLGFGYQYRDYPNDDDIITDELFGDTRLDNIFRLSSGVGAEFWKLTVMFNYRYQFNLSNDSPYVRQIYGLSVKGVF